MGPRSHERGNVLEAVRPGTAATVLQWGRVLMNAETRHCAMRPYGFGACFNGAAFS